MRALLTNLALSGAIAAGAGLAIVSLPGTHTAEQDIQSSATQEAVDATSAEFAVETLRVELIEPFVPPGDSEQTVYDRKLVIEGRGFYGTSLGPWVHLDGEDAFGVELFPGEESSTITVYLPAERRGATEVEVVLPDGRRQSGHIGL